MTLAARLKPWHRHNARLLLIFLAAHLLSHLAAIFGPDSQAAVMNAARAVYRTPVIEIPLIGLFIAQVGLGLIMVWPRIRQSQKPLWSWIQIVSGIYLAVFILNHIFLGILRGRTFDGVETGFHFVAATLVTAPIKYGFIPYYFLAIVALFAHLAAALHWSGRSTRITRGLIILGVTIASLVTASYAGLFYPIELPDAYNAYLDKAF
ncbi:hypothetical protein ACFFUB_08680 [Algimonas porphyrae]|uniref:Uncharacterized protein n=1 Tax=Algimonas porphyrae TaxID=1128113 RepID=A0ABQ5V4D1_9PROT|nr:hypothetical protein [Algimonas porphyrae]GLQ21912.1 hypothetical protein GCM10007854_28670 [Algimonas porphyrae]